LKTFLPVKNLFAYATLSYVSSLHVCTVMNLKVISILVHCTYHQNARMDS